MIKKKSNSKSLLEYIQGGNLEILKTLESSTEPLKFKELRETINPKTAKKFSSSTIATSIKNLEEKGMIKNSIIKIKKRNTIGYEITNSGIEILNILKETEDKIYNKLKK